MMRKFIKKILVKKWAREIASEFTPQPESKGNICGLGGQGYQPFSRSWDSIYQEAPLMIRKAIDPNTNLTMRECLFFGYFGPLEYWCETYLQGQYYLWSDLYGINLILTEERDKVFWELKWGPKLPPARIMEGINVQ